MLLSCFIPPNVFFNDPCVNMSPPFLIVRAAFTTLLTFREIPGYVLFKDPILISWLLLNPLNSQGFGHCFALLNLSWDLLGDLTRKRNHDSSGHCSSFAYSPTSFCDFPGNGKRILRGVSPVAMLSHCSNTPTLGFLPIEWPTHDIWRFEQLLALLFGGGGIVHLNKGQNEMRGCDRRTKT